MLHTVIKKNSYQDSVSLMLLSNRLSDAAGVNRISIMMGTPANKEIFQTTGLWTEEVDKAGPNDICIVVDVENPDLVGDIVAKVDHFLANQASKSQSAGFATVRSWDTAMSTLPDANMTLVSLPGQYAAAEARKALEKGLHVFMFSDNVSVEDELELKKLARDKGLLVMGPDCGTGIIGNIPVAFANVVAGGNIGIVGASGTGIQEVTSVIHRLGGGISHAIGTGGRDLSEKIGAITVMAALKGLAADSKTEVIVLISKPPAKAVRDKVISLLRRLPKPVVAIFMGEKPGADHDNIRYAWTLEDAATLAVELAHAPAQPATEELPSALADKVSAIQAQGGRKLKGLYSGGTLAAEAAMLLKEALGGVDESSHAEGIMLQLDGNEIIDLGDDVYTRGKPHPMIDPRTRADMLIEAAGQPETAIILFDVVLGYGSNDDMAGAMAEAIAKAKAKNPGKETLYIASVCGTDQDPQNYQEQIDTLAKAGVVVAASNAKAVRLAVSAAKHLTDVRPAAPVAELLQGKPRVINMGLRSFAETCEKYGGQVVQFDWTPAAGGNARLAGLLSKLK